MVKYTIALKILGSANENYSYSLSLTPQQEDRPEQIFTPEIRESMRNSLQKLSSCKIGDNHLNQMIRTWTEDIKEGYRNSTITLDLPLMVASNMANLQENGNQELPALIDPNLLEIEPSFGMLPPLIFS